MKCTFDNELISLKSWINNVNTGLMSFDRITTDVTSANNVFTQVHAVANGIEHEYPFYSNELRRIAGILFGNQINGTVPLNNVAYGELFIIIRHITIEPVNMSLWCEIHPRIVRISQALFRDRYYDSAAEKAVRELETRLRELFAELKPNSTVPAKIGEVIGALLTENGAYHFADLSTVSGKDYRKGIQSLFEGIFAAYRNPSAHKNIAYSKREAIEQIMLASQLMYVLDNK